MIHVLEPPEEHKTAPPPPPIMNFTIGCEEEEDGRWIA